MIEATRTPAQIEQLDRLEAIERARNPEIMTPAAKADALAVLTAATRALEGRVTNDAYLDHMCALDDLTERLELAEAWSRGGHEAAPATTGLRQSAGSGWAALSG